MLNIIWNQLLIDQLSSLFWITAYREYTQYSYIMPPNTDNSNNKKMLSATLDRENRGIRVAISCSLLVTINYSLINRSMWHSVKWSFAKLLQKSRNEKPGW